MKISFLLLLLLASCYTKTKKPDYKFMNKIDAQASLDPALRTTIEVTPKKYFFEKKNRQEGLKGIFYIKNTGNKTFNIVSIKSNCECIITEYDKKNILPGDSLKVNYEVNIKNQRGFISNTIVAIGNCQFGNQTYYLEGMIF